MMHITLIYAGLLGLLFLLLSFWVVKRRAQFRVMIGEGEAPEMLAAIRAKSKRKSRLPIKPPVLPPLPPRKPNAASK